QNDRRLLRGRLRPRQVLERRQTAVERGVRVEQDRLGALAGLEPERRVQVLELLASPQRRAVELARVALARTQIATHCALEDAGGLADTLPRVTADARALVGRQLLKKDPADFAQFRVVRRQQVRDEKRLVVAPLAVLEIPRRGVSVEQGISLERP